MQISIVVLGCRRGRLKDRSVGCESRGQASSGPVAVVSAFLFLVADTGATGAATTQIAVSRVFSATTVSMSAFLMVDLPWFMCLETRANLLIWVEGRFAIGATTLEDRGRAIVPVVNAECTSAQHALRQAQPVRQIWVREGKTRSVQLLLKCQERSKVNSEATAGEDYEAG